jgi:DNA-binding PadR family transcriptional regulator
MELAEQAGRPRRRVYRITSEGRVALAMVPDAAGEARLKRNQACTHRPGDPSV